MQAHSQIATANGRQVVTEGERLSWRGLSGQLFTTLSEVGDNPAQGCGGADNHSQHQQDNDEIGGQATEGHIVKFHRHK